MSSEIKSSTTDELRMKNHRTQLENRNELELRSLRDRHSDDVQRMMEAQAFQRDNIKQAYEVQISQEAENLEQKLHETRMENEKRVDDEKRVADQEVTKIKTMNQQQIQEYKKNSEAQIEALKKQYMATAEALHNKAKQARRDQEVSKK